MALYYSVVAYRCAMLPHRLRAELPHEGAKGFFANASANYRIQTPGSLVRELPPQRVREHRGATLEGPSAPNAPRGNPEPKHYEGGEYYR